MGTRFWLTIAQHRQPSITWSALPMAWAAQSVASGRASTPKNPQYMFRIAAVAFLRAIDRFRVNPPSPPGRYADRIEAFIQEQRQSRWQSAETCRVRRSQVVTFLSYLEEQGCD